MSQPAARFARLALLCCLATAKPAAAAPWSSFATDTDVAVRTHDGRTLRGRIDPRSSDDTLWLAAEAAGITITSTTPAADVLEVVAAAPVTLPPLWTEIIDDRPAPSPSPAGAPIAANNRVQSLELFAMPANWDADPEIDGLRVWVLPRNAHGEPVAIGGSLRGELLVETGDARPANRHFAVEERWQRELSTTEFGPEGAVLELPFRHLRPEARTEFPPLGVLQMRLMVPGQGAYDAVLSDVLLTLPSWNRDRSELLTGKRYFPGEPRPQRP